MMITNGTTKGKQSSCDHFTPVLALCLALVSTLSDVNLIATCHPIHIKHADYGNHTVVNIQAQRKSSPWIYFESIYIDEGHVNPLNYLQKRDCIASNSQFEDNMGEGDDYSECSTPLKHKLNFSGQYNGKDLDDLSYEAQQYDGDHAHKNDVVTLANTLADDFDNGRASQACMCMEKNTNNLAVFFGSLEYGTANNPTPPDQNMCFDPAIDYAKSHGQTSSCENLGYSS